MSSLMTKMLKATGKDSRSSILTQSKFFDKKPLCTTRVPMANLLMSGLINGGITAGITMVVGDSRTFKTNMCLFIVSEYMRKYPEAICVFVDSEFGAASAYFKTFGIDTDRVMHVPVENIEQMTFECTQILNSVDKDEKVIFFIDSISQVSSKKEAADALEGKGTTDMTRARTLNSFWRIVTPMLNLRGIPMFAINSFYDDMTNKYAERHIKGGKQGFLSSDAVWFVTRSKEKDDENDLAGFTFNYAPMKSRFVKEGTKFPIRVTFEGGIDIYSGIWDLLREFDLVHMPSNAWYTVDPRLELPEYNPTDKYRKADLATPEFFDKVIKFSDAFSEACTAKYKLSEGEMFDVSANKNEIIIQETGEIIKLED